MNAPTKRALTNELSTLLERLNPQALVAVAKAFPAFTEEFRHGPDAGDEPTDRKYLEDRAALAMALCDKLVPEIDRAAEKIIARASSLSSSKLAVAIIAGIGGASTLAAVGIGKDEAARIAGIFTSAVAILNAALDSLSKRYSSSEVQKSIDVRQAGASLALFSSELKLAVEHSRPEAELRDAIEKCNQLAADLYKKRDQLRLV